MTKSPTSPTRRVLGASLASFVTALLLVAGVTPAASAAPSSITVRVTTVAGTPLTGAAISAIQVSQGVEVGKVDAVETPAKSGTYLFTGSLDSANQYTLFLDTPATSTSAGYQQFWGGGTSVGDARTFTPAAGNNQLNFSVLASSFGGKTLTSAGKALKSVTVELFKWTGTGWDSIEDVVSASTGAYSFTGLEPGSYTARFDTTLAQPGYVSTLAGGVAVTGSTAKTPTNIASATPFYVSYGKPAVLNQKIATGAKITGVVRGSGTPLVGVKVGAIALTGSQAGGWTSAEVSPAAQVVTAAGGKFTLAGLAAGTYALSLTPTVAQAATFSNPYRNPVTTSVAPQVVTVAAGKTVTASVTATSLTVGNGTTGTVTLGVAGGPAGVTGAIEFLGATGSSTSVALPSSTTTQVVLPAGTYSYQARPTGRKPVYGTVTVAAGGATGVTVPYDTEVAMAFAAAPTVAQTATVVGTTYTVAAASNHPTTTRLDYQWFRGGLPIFGARSGSYTSGAGDLGTQLAVRVVIRDLEGGADLGAAVNAGSGVVTSGPAATNTVLPSISPSTGTRVGTTLFATPGTWSRAGSYFTYQWRRFGSDIPGATGSTYLVTGADAMLPVTVVVTAHKAGFASSAQAISVPVAPAYLDGPAAKTAPKVTSKAASGGKTLYTVSKGAWTPTPESIVIAWTADGAPIAASANAGTFLYDPAGPYGGAAIRATVTPTKYGYATSGVSLVVRKGTNATQTQGVVANLTTVSMVNASTPVTVGDTLSVNGGDVTSAQGPLTGTVKYQWQRGTANIAGATAQTYILTGADVGVSLRVIVTQTFPDYTVPAEILAAGVGVIGSELAGESATVAITGDQAVKGKLTAKRTSSWTASGVSDTFQWYTCGSVDEACGSPTPIAGATASTYVIPASLEGQYLTARLVGTKTGSVPSQATFSNVVRAWQANVLVPLTAPTIASGLVGGDAMVGERLTAGPGVYNVSGVTLKYEWRYCGGGPQCSDSDACVREANWWVDSTGTTLSYTPGGPTYGSGDRHVRLCEIASKKGYPTRITATPMVDIVPGHEFEVVAPKFTVSGNKYTLASGYWEGTLNYGDPDFTWLLDGLEVPGANGKTFTRAPADAGKTLKLYVAVSNGEPTGPSNAFGVSDFTKTYLVAKGTTGVPAASAIIGNGVGSVLGAPSTPFTYGGDAGASSITYQWFSAGKAIAGATSSTFTPGAAYRGRVLTVKRTFSSDNYSTAVSTSLPLTLAYGDDVGGTPTMSASGPVVPGTVLTGSATGYPTPAYALTYQWQSSANNSTFTNIAKATKSTYTILPTEVGKFLRVAVTSSRAGYQTLTKPSASVQVLTSGVLSPTSPASLSGIDANGQVKAGQTLTIVAARFPVTATSSYRWLRNGVVIPGATSTTYKATGSDYLDAISVEVTAKSTGYSDYVGFTSPATVTTGVAPVASKLPAISGAAKECTTLTASTGTWPADGVTFSFAWYSNAAPTTVIGSNPSYTVPDNTHTGAKLFVVVTATAKGFATATAQSAPTAAIANACP